MQSLHNWGKIDAWLSVLEHIHRTRIPSLSALNTRHRSAAGYFQDPPSPSSSKASVEQCMAVGR